MIRKIIAPLFILLISFNPSKALTQTFPSVDSTIAAIKALYDGGSYIQAELQSRRVLEDQTVSDSDRVELEKYLAFSLVAEGKNRAAAEHFVKALKIDSTLALDPVLTSPKILAVFETARAEFHREEAREHSRTKEVLQQEPSAAMHSGPTFRVILFPGWEQLYDRKETKGLIFLSAGLVTAASAITFSFLKAGAKRSYLDAPTPSLAASRYGYYNFCYKAQLYSIGAFVIVYLYSEVDSFINLPPYFQADYLPITKGGMVNLRFSF